MFKFIKKMFSSEGKVEDPVCGMAVNSAKTQFKSVHKDKEYFFCSENCKTQFDQNPQDFI